MAETAPRSSSARPEAPFGRAMLSGRGSRFVLVPGIVVVVILFLFSVIPQTAPSRVSGERNTPAERLRGHLIELAQRGEAALAAYQPAAHEAAGAEFSALYFDVFEASGMENKIGSRDAAFKTTLEAYFTRMVSLMKAGQPQETASRTTTR